MKKFVVALAVVAAVLGAGGAWGWDGYDYESDSFIEIDRGNKVRAGETIDYFDYSSGEYKDGDVTDVQRYGNSVEVEVYDYEKGDYRTFEMDGNQ